MKDLDQIRAIRNSLIEQVQELDKYIEQNEQKPVLLSATLEGNMITVVFTAKQNIDIHYWYDEKIHSVEKYGHDVDESTGKFEIGVNQPEKPWKVQIVADDFASQVEDVKVIKSIPESKPKNLFFGFWDSQSVPENELKKLSTVGHTLTPFYDAMRQVVDGGRKVIPAFGGFASSDSDKKLRDRIGWYLPEFEKIGWENIQFILLRDEPYLKGFTKHQLDVIVDEAKKQYKSPVTFSFSRGPVMGEPLPDLDIVAVNLYPLFQKDAPAGYPQLWDYDSFKSLFDDVMKKIQQKAPGADVVITAQVFGERTGDGEGIPWRTPEPGTAEWYMKAISEYPEITGVLWWGWDVKRRLSFSENAELQKAWLKVIQ